jgi:hypothetical protein
MTPLRLLVLANAALLAGLWATAWALGDGLPERIPVHFDLAGRPDRFGGREAFLALPAAGTLVAATILASAAISIRLARRRPGLINLPRKAAFLALGPEERVRAVAPVAGYLGVLSLLVGLLILLLMVDTHAVATGRAETIAVWPVWAMLAAALAGLVPLVLAVRGRIGAMASAPGPRT